MIEEAFFQSDILTNIYRNFAFHFSWYGNNGYFPAVAAIILCLLVNWLSVRFFFAGKYPSFVCEKSCFFTPADRPCLSVLLFSVCLYAGAVFGQEMSLFRNFDNMTIDYVESLKRGTLPVIAEWRFAPLQGIDYNILYGITHHPLVIHFYVLLKQILCLYLLYRLFVHIPVSKRLIMLSLINVVPAVFAINGIIFSEQNILIFVSASLLCLKKYGQTGKSGSLLGFLVFMNFAMYSKETVILFYAGFALYLLFDAVIREKISLTSFVRPWQTLRMFPLEYLMFWSMFLFATCWLLLTPVNEENRYVETHARSLSELVPGYFTELLLLLAAVTVLFVKLFKKEWGRLSLFGEGSLCGCLMIAGYVVFGMRIAPLADGFLSYYLYLPAVFCTAYIFANVSRNKILVPLCAVVALLSLYVDAASFAAAKGKDRRDVAEYIISQAKYRPVTVYLQIKGTTDHRWWKSMAWSSALKYVAPSARLLLKVDYDIYRFYVREGKDFVRKIPARPNAGDYVLVNLKDDPGYTPKTDYVSAYRNKTYQLYYIEPQDDNRTVSEN